MNGQIITILIRQEVNPYGMEYGVWTYGTVHYRTVRYGKYNNDRIGSINDRTEIFQCSMSIGQDHIRNYS